MSKIDPHTWQKFKISKLFEIKKVYGKPLSEYEVGSTPYVTGAENNNGIVGYVSAPSEAISKGGCIAVDPIKGFAMYQPEDFVGRGFSGASINLLYNEKLTEETAIYCCTAIEKVSKSVAAYTNLFNSDRLKNAEIMLPVITKDVPDWNYMQECIAEQMQKCITELDRYLTAAGLNNYALTEDDLRVLSLSGYRCEEVRDNAVDVGVQKEMREFRIGNLFDKVNSEFYGKPNNYVGRKSHTTTEPDSAHTIPLTCAKMGDNGIMYYGETGMFSAEPNCLAMIRDGAVSTGLVYAQEQPTGVLSHSYLMKCKVDVAFETLLYCASVMTKALYPLYTRDNPSLWSGKVENDMIPLPVQTDESGDPIIDPDKIYHLKGYIPDWDYMSAYIRVIEKLVIADVVKYKDKIILKETKP